MCLILKKKLFIDLFTNFTSCTPISVTSRPACLYPPFALATSTQNKIKPKRKTKIQTKTNRSNTKAKQNKIPRRESCSVASKSHSMPLVQASLHVSVHCSGPLVRFNASGFCYTLNTAPSLTLLYCWCHVSRPCSSDI